MCGPPSKQLEYRRRGMDKTQITNAQKNFLSTDLAKMREIFDSLADNKERALQFVRDPDKFMHEQLGTENISANMHFHVVVGDRMYPVEEQEPENQILFTARVKLADAIREDVFLEFERVSPFDPDFPGGEIPGIPRGGVDPLDPRRDPKPEPLPKPEPKPDPPPKPEPKPDPPPGPGDCPGCGECARVILH
jgi:hypothetical protein